MQRLSYGNFFLILFVWACCILFFCQSNKSVTFIYAFLSGSAFPGTIHRSTNCSARGLLRVDCRLSVLCCVLVMSLAWAILFSLYVVPNFILTASQMITGLFLIYFLICRLVKRDTEKTFSVKCIFTIGFVHVEKSVMVYYKYCVSVHFYLNNFWLNNCKGYEYDRS